MRHADAAGLFALLRSFGPGELQCYTTDGDPCSIGDNATQVCIHLTLLARHRAILESLTVKESCSPCNCADLAALPRLRSLQLT